MKVALNRKYSVTQMCDENPKICLVANFYGDIWNQHEKTYQKLHRFEEKCKKLDFLGSLSMVLFSLTGDGPTDRRTDGRTDGQTEPLIEMRGRI